MRQPNVYTRPEKSQKFNFLFIFINLSLNVGPMTLENSVEYMNKDIYKILSTQFLTAFADNAALFIIITIVMQQTDIGSWYIPALQASFLVAYVIFAPWAGRFSDIREKRQIMMVANGIKALGALLLFIQLEPMLAYAIIGLGAALYSPAKYGILPEIVKENRLVKINGWVEGSTILAILSGTLAGAMLAEYSISAAIISVIVLYICSAAFAYTIQHNHIAGHTSKRPLHVFYMQIRGLFKTTTARFSLLGVSLFWASATVLRVLLIAWAPAVLMLNSSTDIAKLTLFIAIGIAIGSLLAPLLIPITRLQRTRLAAYAMGCLIIVLSFIDTPLAARIALLLVGICGGLFVVPINAILQDIGHRSIGAGGAVAVENFFNNLAMLIASGLYALVASSAISPVATMGALGIIIVIITLIISMRLPAQ